ncbi:serine hydrolase [Sphingomonas alpina]|uniref:Class A beta-lactamase-related serine hydrolase n=1 Tax=Sphingomonas alpina TaxID=653931 RepID=A0A7H0LNT0_9SPHN|nr:serine hydrolase [Sphingomonas alpina]QNQ11333.1 class A beta-lactamase-related serine hydrolase [Sphingomonas alpina]
MRIGVFLRGAITLLALAAIPARAAPDPGAQVDAIMRRLMAERHVPGAQVAVVRGGRVALLRHYGIANLQTPVAVTDSTIFSVNSITKAFTGVAAMRAVEAGRLDLSKRVGDYLSDLPEAWRGVTVRQLLSHSSGLPNFAGSAGSKQGEEAAAWGWALAQPVRFPPGERFDYSQTNYALLQNILNALDGHPLDAPVVLAQTALVGMPGTGLHDSREVVSGKSAAYALENGAPRGLFETFSPKHRAASGMDSTAADMARWMNAILDGRLLGAAARQTMWTRVPFTNGSLGQWGMGWLVMDRVRHRSVGMTGGSRSAMFLYPDDNVGVVILTNLAGATPEDMADQIAALYIPGMQLEGVGALRAALDRQGYGDASAVLAGLRRDPGFRVDEHELNDWAYRLLSFGKPKEALAVMKIGVELFPRSGNAYDSLADAYAINGEKAAAIASYERSIALDPSNAHAVQRLKALRK